MIRGLASILLLAMLSHPPRAASTDHAIVVQFASMDRMPAADAPEAVVTQCAAPEVTTRGVGIPELTIGWAASLVTGAIERRLQREIAKYSSEVRSRRTFLPFYDEDRWFVDAEGNLVSCLYLAAGDCDDAAAACEQSFETSLEVFAQFRRTDQYLQVRPLAWRSRKPLPASIHQGRSRIAVRLDARAIWRSGEEGRNDHVFSVPIIAGRVRPATRGVWVVVPGGWHHAETLPLPPVAEDGRGLGLVGLRATMAEVSAPPAALRGLARYVEDNRRGLSAALAQAIDDALNEP